MITDAETVGNGLLNKCKHSYALGFKRKQGRDNESVGKSFRALFQTENYRLVLPWIQPGVLHMI